MSTVNIRAPSAADLGLTPGEPVVAEILNHNLDVVNRVALQTGEEQAVEVPKGEYHIRIRLTDGQDLFTRAESAASEGRWAVARALHGLAALIEPDDLMLTEGSRRPSIRKSLSDVVARIADGATREVAKLDLDQIARGSIVIEAPPAAVPDKLKTARAVLWARDGDAWARSDMAALRPLGRCRFSLSLPRERLFALQVGGPSLPWRFVMLPSTDVHVAIVEATSQSQLDVEVGVKVTLSNPKAESIIRYLEAGATQDARFVAENGATELLQAKELDVVGAVVGAYCLLKTGGDDRFREWPKRLADLYSWLPDVHVIHAWQLLDEPGAPEFAIAERRLLQAESTGLPVFSAGLQRLYDGLLAFRDDPDTPDDQAVHDAASRLKPYVASASIQHTYSTYYGASPSEPNVEPVLGELPGGMEIGVDADA